MSVLLGCASTGPLDLPAQEDPYYDGPLPRFTDQVYSPTVRTVQLYKQGFALSQPILELGSGDRLELHFDDLQDQAEYLSYTLVHCDADWRPSDVPKGQYLEGAFTDYLPPPRLSFNTLQPYFHYALEVPNDRMRPTRSGNYLLKVFRDNDEEDLVLTRRLLVFEQQVWLDTQVQASRNVDERNSAQQLDLTIRYPGLDVPDPFGDLRVVALQNMRWDAAHSGFKPRFVRTNELIYDFPDAGLFPGNNEWRNFDVKDLRFRHQQVASIVNGPRLTDVFLVPDTKRNIRVYFEQPDINGRYLVQHVEFDDADRNADYVNVHFTLKLDAPLYGGGVYVYGALSDFQCRKEFRMNWDRERDLYHLTVPLKQGFYDYAYAFLPDGSEVSDLTRLEGSHFQTENEYLVLVYFTDYQLRMQRLVGLRSFATRMRN